jgi:hypothetical protein
MYGTKKTKVKLVAANTVKSIALTTAKIEKHEYYKCGISSHMPIASVNEDEVTVLVSNEHYSDKKIVNGNLTVKVSLDVQAVSDTCFVSEKGKVYSMAHATAYDSVAFEQKDKVVVGDKPDPEQAKIKGKLAKDNKSITFTIKKGTAIGTTAYFMVHYNNNDGGYKIIKVTIGSR